MNDMIILLLEYDENLEIILNPSLALPYILVYIFNASLSSVEMPPKYFWNPFTSLNLYH